MNKCEIKEKVKDILIDVLVLEKTKDEIVGEDLINELGINSIDAISLFIEIEDTFDIEIDDDNLNAALISSIDKISNYIADRIS